MRRCYHRRMKAQGSVLSLLLFAAACASAPSNTPAAAVKPPVVTWEEKLAWILRLEDQRILRDPNPPGPVILIQGSGS